MKRTVIKPMITIIPLFLLLFSGQQGFSAAPDKKAKGKDKYAQVDFAVDGHPRLLLDAAELPRMRGKVKGNPYLSRLHGYITDYADQTLSQPVNKREMRGIRLLYTSVDNLTRIFYCSYAYRMTGDEKYARRAIDEMLAAAAFDDWNPSHFLDTAEMTFALAIGYDWCYPVLSDGEKTVIRNAIIEKGLKHGLDERYNKRWLGKNANWNQVCCAGMLFGALAVEDYAPQYAEDYLRILVPSISNPMGEMYSPSGAYPEGPGYWIYGTSYNVIFLEQCKKRYGSYLGLVDDNPDFMKTIDFANAMITPTLGTFAYMDHAFSAQIGIVPFWFYAHTGDPSHLYQQARLLNSLDTITLDDSRHRRLLPAAVVFGTAGRKLPDKPDEPKWLAYIGVGGRTPVTVFRSGWSSPEDLYLGFKCGKAWISHGHMDVGSFLMEADGVKWATELGSENYENMEKLTEYGFWKFERDSKRWTLLRYSDRGHNVLLFENAMMDPAERADIDDFSADEKLMYATADLSALYRESVSGVRRTVSMPDKSYVIIQDRIETGGESVQMRWNMCTEAETFTEKDGNHYVLTKEGKTLHMIVEAGNPIEGGSWNAIPSHQEECANPDKQFVGFTSMLEAGNIYDFKVYLVPDKAFAGFSESRNKTF